MWNIFRVPRAVGQLNAIWVQTTNLISSYVMWHDNNITSTVIQLTQNTSFCAVIHKHQYRSLVPGLLYIFGVDVRAT